MRDFALAFSVIGLIALAPVVFILKTTNESLDSKSIDYSRRISDIDSRIDSLYQPEKLLNKPDKYVKKSSECPEGGLEVLDRKNTYEIVYEVTQQYPPRGIANCFY